MKRDKTTLLINLVSFGDKKSIFISSIEHEKQLKINIFYLENNNIVSKFSKNLDQGNI